MNKKNQNIKMTGLETYEQLVETVSNMKTDAEKFFKDGNKSAGTRLRKQVQEVKKLGQELRFIVQAEKNAEDSK